MSVFSNKSEEIKSRLESVEALEGVPILIDRQKDLKSDFTKAINKKKGSAIIIFWEGYAPYEADIADSQAVSDFLVTVWTKPILRGCETAADNLVEAIHRALHGWNHEGDCRSSCEVKSGRILPHPAYLIHELKLRVRHNF